MYNKCCIENCASKRQDVKMHQFPKSEIGLQKWLQCIGSVHLRSCSLQSLRKMFVCHKHFETRFSKTDLFKKLTSEMNPLAKKVFWMQGQQYTKKVRGIRFSNEEKMIALKRIFILPSKNTLNKMISNIKVLPGINKQIFDTMKQETTSWSENKRYCSIIFDEVSLQPGLTYCRSRDAINGFVELKSKSCHFADHALTFMIRGAIHKWQQPIAYYFCEGATKRDQLRVIIKEIVAAVVDAGLLPVALICDQGTAFQSTINSLLEDTRQEQIKAGERIGEFKN